MITRLGSALRLFVGEFSLDGEARGGGEPERTERLGRMRVRAARRGVAHQRQRAALVKKLPEQQPPTVQA